MTPGTAQATILTPHSSQEPRKVLQEDQMGDERWALWLSFVGRSSLNR